jgi:hypothetical protein
LNARSIEFELLVRAAGGMPFAGFTTEVVGMEFLRNAYDGFSVGDRQRRFTEEDVEAFLELFVPLFDAANIRDSPLGRALTPNHSLHDKPLGQVVYELTGRTRPELLEDLDQHPAVRSGASVAHFDPFDLHLVLAAIEHGATMICTNNTTDYSMGSIGDIAVVTPTALADAFGLR